MKQQLTCRLSTILFSIVFFSATVQAMSSTPDDNENYSPANWLSSKSAEDDARFAINNKDLRLLGFALRGYNIPGVETGKQQNYIDKCGIRVFEEFGDVVRNQQQIEQMKQAREYAISYNAIILESCSLD